jgi:hypothetical protein
MPRRLPRGCTCHVMVCYTHSVHFNRLRFQRGLVVPADLLCRPTVPCCMLCVLQYEGTATSGNCENTCTDPATSNDQWCCQDVSHRLSDTCGWWQLPTACCNLA